MMVVTPVPHLRHSNQLTITDTFTPWRHKISNSVHCVSKIPRRHHVDGLAVIDQRLDSSLTGKLDKVELSVVSWMLTKVRPNFLLTELRGEYSSKDSKGVGDAVEHNG